MCGGSTAGVSGRDSSFYPCHTYIKNGQQRFQGLKRPQDESVWGQYDDMQGCSTGDAVTQHCSSTSLAGLTLPSTAPLLGILVSVVDEVASNFVFGPYGSSGRPRGVMDISIIHILAATKRLSSACQNRWLKFLQQWQNAGWNADSLLEFAGTLRPLQYKSDLDYTYIDGVTKEDLLKLITELYAEQTFILMGQSDVEDLVKVVNCHFSKPDAILQPVPHNVYQIQDFRIVSKG